MAQLADFNYKMSGGMFDRRQRVLATFSIHFNEKVQRFVVRDDRNDDAVVGSGYATLDRAIAAHKWQDDQRTCALIRA